MLEKAKEALLARVPSLPPAALLALLEASFPFVGIPELRAVPLAVRQAYSPPKACFRRCEWPVSTTLASPNCALRQLHRV